MRKEASEALLQLASSSTEIQRTEEKIDSELGLFMCDKKFLADHPNSVTITTSMLY